jgi:hypothetical protein
MRAVEFITIPTMRESQVKLRRKHKVSQWVSLASRMARRKRSVEAEVAPRETSLMQGMIAGAMAFMGLFCPSQYNTSPLHMTVVLELYAYPVYHLTATPEQFETPIVVATEDPTPTQEVWLSLHQQSAIAHVNSCLVNQNPTLIGDTITYTIWNGRNTDIPQGYRFAPVTSPSPFVYCYASLPGCRFEFQWLQGNMGYQAEDVTTYPDTVYLIKLPYSLNAACS